MPYIQELSESDEFSSSSTTGSTIITPGVDPSVIVGLACRVPGAENPSQLWKLMGEQRDLRMKIPEDRFSVDGFYHPEGTNKGTVGT